MQKILGRSKGWNAKDTGMQTAPAELRLTCSWQTRRGQLLHPGSKYTCTSQQPAEPTVWLMSVGTAADTAPTSHCWSSGE